MTRRQKDPLRPLSVEEHQMLEKLSRAKREPSVHVVRAQLLLAVAKGKSYRRQLSPLDAAQGMRYHI
jgi:hypothetical protein